MSEEEFQKEITKALLKHDKEKLASIFHVSKSTVKRWADGVSFPGPRVREFIVQEIATWETENEQSSDS